MLVLAINAAVYWFVWRTRRRNPRLGART